jgi:hypothetical protein
MAPATCLPRLAGSSIGRTWAELACIEIPQANPGMALQKPPWRHGRFAWTTVEAIRVEPRKGRRKQRRFCQSRTHWKSFAHIPGGKKLTLLCGRNCQALWSACLSFLVSTAALLVRMGCALAHTGNVHEWVGCSPHAPGGDLHLLGTAHSSRASASPVPLLSRLLTDARRCGVPRSPRGSARDVGCWLRDAWGLLAPNDLLSVLAALPPSTPSCLRPEAPREAPG